MKKLLVFVSVFVLGITNVVQVAQATSVSENAEVIAPAEENEEIVTPAEEPTEPVVEEPAEPVVEEPAEEPAEQVVEEPVAEEPAEEQTEEVAEEVAEEPAETKTTVNIPDFTSQDYKEVRAQMEAVEGVEWMLEYIYAEEAEDTILSQDIIGETEVTEGLTVKVVISLGKEPEQVPEEETEDTELLSSIGLGALLGNCGLGLGDFSAWDNMPYSYEYVYDNSNECWNWGVWHEGVCYTTPEGEYSNDVRHKMSLYTDGEYVYCYIRFATCYGPGFNSEDLQFYINGQMAAFQLTFKPDGVITGNVDELAPGVYEIEVKHRNSAMSYTKAEGSVAYLQIDPAGKNNAVEMAIPLDTIKEQNPSIDLSRVDTLEFFSPNLMYRRISCSGANTAPFVWAAAAFVCVPTGVYISRKKALKKDK